MGGSALVVRCRSGVIDAVDDVPAKLDIIVGEFANLGLIHAHELLLLRSTELQARDEVDDEEDDTTEDKRVGHACNTVTELVGELDVVVVEPAPLDFGQAIKVSNVICGKEAGQKISNQTANAVDGEDIKRIVNPKDELQFGGIIAGDAPDDTKDNSRPGRNVPTSRSNGDQTRNHATAEADGRPFALQAVIKETPGYSTDTGGQVRDDGGHDSTQVCGESATGIETEPSEDLLVYRQSRSCRKHHIPDPEEDGSNDDVGDVVRTIVQLVGTVAPALPQHQRVSQCGRA